MDRARRATHAAGATAHAAGGSRGGRPGAARNVLEPGSKEPVENRSDFQRRNSFERASLASRADYIYIRVFLHVIHVNRMLCRECREPRSQLYRRRFRK